MPKFSSQSLDVIETCHHEIRAVVFEAIKFTDFSALCGYRGQEAQHEAFLMGRSKKDWPNGKHIVSPSEAIDVAPYPIDWKDTHRFAVLAGRLMQIGSVLGVDLRWGSDWDGDTRTLDQQFMDWGHFELL